MRMGWVVILVALGLAAPILARAAPSAGVPSTSLAAADYSNPDNWLCRPDRASDPCTVDLSTTKINSDGQSSVETFSSNPEPPIDCFYVYPTVSRDPGPLANLALEPEERRVAMQQFARFGAKCRLFAPLYRQYTLKAMFANLLGHPMEGADTTEIRDAGYNDVLAAWKYYLAHDNCRFQL